MYMVESVKKIIWPYSHKIYEFYNHTPISSNKNIRLDTVFSLVVWTGVQKNLKKQIGYGPTTVPITLSNGPLYSTSQES
jgi:hypothetical protein